MARTMPGAGELRERITVQRVSTTRDDMGGLIETWADLATLWARVEQASSGEQFRRQQAGATAAWTVTVRWRGDLRPADRISWRGRSFEIVALENPDLRRRFLAIACNELRVGQTQVAS